MPLNILKADMHFKNCEIISKKRVCNRVYDIANLKFNRMHFTYYLKSPK